MAVTFYVIPWVFRCDGESQVYVDIERLYPSIKDIYLSGHVSEKNEKEFLTLFRHYIEMMLWETRRE